jgi:hypothetical protein
MRRHFIVLIAGIALAAIGLSHPAAAATTAASPAWSMNATIIEACSCPMFCQCYFSTKPAAHHDKDDKAGMSGMDMEGEHYCRANNAFRVNKGNYGATARWGQILAEHGSRRRLLGRNDEVVHRDVRPS